MEKESSTVSNAKRSHEANTSYITTCPGDSNSHNQNHNKHFFTTTDLLEKINSILSSSADANRNNENDCTQKHFDENDDAPRFELQRRLPDGTTRKATPQESAAADFQSKLKQVRTSDSYA